MGMLPGTGGCEEHTIVWVPLGTVQTPLCIAVMEGKRKGNFLWAKALDCVFCLWRLI